MAREAGVPFFYASGSEFGEVFAGMGASRVRSLFEQAITNAPSANFIDKIDSLGASHNQRLRDAQTPTQFLEVLDGFEPRTNVIAFAATNRIEDLDLALLITPGYHPKKETFAKKRRNMGTCSRPSSWACKTGSICQICILNLKPAFLDSKAETFC